MSPLRGLKRAALAVGPSRSWPMGSRSLSWGRKAGSWMQRIEIYYRSRFYELGSVVDPQNEGLKKGSKWGHFGGPGGGPKKGPKRVILGVPGGGPNLAIFCIFLYFYKNIY